MQKKREYDRILRVKKIAEIEIAEIKAKKTKKTGQLNDKELTEKCRKQFFSTFAFSHVSAGRK